jgi:light-regulated signal transduction histidine kinase (bacteriophytochrome)
VLLETELFPDLGSIMGDRVQLQQVVLNLIRNGIEAMSAVTLRPRVLRVSSRFDEHGDVIIAITDGLDPTKIERIFDAFFTTKPEGMGMGLSICQSSEPRGDADRRRGEQSAVKAKVDASEKSIQMVVSDTRAASTAGVSFGSTASGETRTSGNRQTGVRRKR